LDKVWQWLYDLHVSETVRESRLIFTTLEWTHLYSMVVLVSVTASVYLRLMGFSLTRGPRPPLSQLVRRVWKWALLAFTVNLITGAFLFAQNAPQYVINTAFLLKMLSIAVAVVCNAVLFFTTSRWDDARPVPTVGTRLLAGFLLLLWLCVIAASRWIAFVGSAA